jgi:hypothetical protein
VNIGFMMAGCHMQVASEDGARLRMGVLARDKACVKSISMVGGVFLAGIRWYELECSMVPRRDAV